VPRAPAGRDSQGRQEAGGKEARLRCRVMWGATFTAYAIFVPSFIRGGMRLKRLQKGSDHNEG